MKRGIKVIDVMTRNPIFVSPDTTLIDCAKKMLDEKVGSLIIKDKKKVVGIVTEKDFVERVVAKNIDAKSTKVRNIMSREIISINPDADISEAIKKMTQKNVRRMPVVDSNEIIGLLTIKDILAVEPQLFNNFLDKLDIREHKNIMLNTIQGTCTNCKSYGEVTRSGRNNWLCEACK